MPCATQSLGALKRATCQWNSSPRIVPALEFKGGRQSYGPGMRVAMDSGVDAFGEDRKGGPGGGSDRSVGISECLGGWVGRVFVA